MPGAFFHRLWNNNNKALVYTVLAISSRIKVSFKIYSSWQFQCTPYLFDLSKNWLRKSQLKNKTNFFFRFWHRLHSSVLNMTLYDIPIIFYDPSIMFYQQSHCQFLFMEMASTFLLSCLELPVLYVLCLDILGDRWIWWQWWWG